MEKDNLIEDVRKYRRQIEQECDNDFHKIFERAKRIQDISVKDRLEKLELMKDKELIAA